MKSNGNLFAIAFKSEKDRQLDPNPDKIKKNSAWETRERIWFYINGVFFSALFFEVYKVGENIICPQNAKCRSVLNFV